MRINFRLVRASQFLPQFRLDVRHNSGKEHIISDALSRLASTNIGCSDLSHFELNALFTYNAILVEIYPGLILRILTGYKDDKYWARLHRQVQANEELGDDKTVLLFVTRDSYRLNNDPYILPRPKSLINPSLGATFPQPKGPVGLSAGFREVAPPPRGSTIRIEDFTLPPPNKTKLLYQVNTTICNL